MGAVFEKDDHAISFCKENQIVTIVRICTHEFKGESIICTFRFKFLLMPLNHESETTLIVELSCVSHFCNQEVSLVLLG